MPREVIDSAPLEFKCQLLGFTSLWLISMAFCSSTEEAVPSFKRQLGQWMLLLLLSFYLQSVGNLSPWKAFSIHHPQECTNHQITGCSAEELSVLPLGAGTAFELINIWKKKLKKWGMTVHPPSYCTHRRGKSLASVSSLQSKQCFMFLNMSMPIGTSQWNLFLLPLGFPPFSFPLHYGSSKSFFKLHTGATEPGMCFLVPASPPSSSDSRVGISDIFMQCLSLKTPF